MPTCAECGKILEVGVEPTSAQCSFCGALVCNKCMRAHFVRCMALQWGFVEVDPKTGELKEVEKPPKFTLE